MVVTLPVIMILLDYWPLKRFESQKGNLFLWQLKEKMPFFILSAVFSIITIYYQFKPSVERFSFEFPNRQRSCCFYDLSGIKIFWPHDLAIFYPFPTQIPVWQVLDSLLLIIIIILLSL